MVQWEWGDIIAASIGGLLVGLATTMQMWLIGRNNGCGGILDAFTGKGRGGNFGWKYAQFAGMIIVGMVLFLATEDDGIKFSDDYSLQFFDNEKVVSVFLPTYTFFIGGTLTGLGMRMGRGCTSGHGLNGLALLSPGSFIAICMFMIFGMGIASLCHHEEFLRIDENDGYWGEDYSDFRYWAAIALLAVTVILLVVLLIRSQDKKLLLASTLIGGIFGLGLSVSGMTRPSKVLGFLTWYKDWDPSLAFVMGFGVMLNLFTFRYIKKNVAKPKFGQEFIKRPEVPINLRTVVGGALFGLGWGIAGFCPGPAMMNFLVLNKVPVWILGCALAMVGMDYYDDKYNATTQIQTVKN